MIKKEDRNLYEYQVQIMRNMENAIITKHLTKEYHGFKANDNIDFIVKKGAICGLIGRNGAGKTTLMRQLLGLCEPTKGEIELLSINLTNARCKTGSLIETPTFYENMSVYENMKIRGMLIGLSNMHNEINHKLKAVGLESKKNSKVKSLSLGMRQKLGIACAILGNPELLILDEPINGLDPIAIKEVRNTLVEMNKQGSTILLSSHILGEMEKIATDYAFLVEGKLVNRLTREEIESKHIDLESYFVELVGGEDNE